MALYASGIESADSSTGQISMEKSKLVTSSSEEVEAYKTMIQVRLIDLVAVYRKPADFHITSLDAVRS